MATPTVRTALIGFLLLLMAPLAGAQISSSPSSIAASLESGSTAEQTLTLHNAGAAPEEVRILRRRTGSDGLGRLYASSGGHFGIVRLDPVTGAAIGDAHWPPRPIGAAVEGLAFDGESIYFAPGSSHNALYRLDPATGEVLASMRLPWNVVLGGLAHNGRALFGVDHEAHAIHEIDIEASEVVRTIEPGFGIIAGLTAGGARGTLFVLGNDGAGIREIDPESGAVVNLLPIEGFFVGMAYSDELEILFVFQQIGSATGTLRALDPDTGETLYTVPSPEYGLMGGLAADEGMGMAAWLSLSQELVTIPAGGSIEVTVHVDASALYAGSQSGELTIVPVGQQAPALVVPVALETSGTPTIVSVPASLSFDGVVAGGTAEQVLTVKNQGTADLEVTTISADDPSISVDAGPLTLRPGRSESVKVSLSPATTGAFSASIVLQSNDPAQPSLIVPVDAGVLPAPSLALSHDVVLADGEAGDATTVVVVVGNDGPGDLNVAVYGGTAGLLAPGRVTPVGYLPSVISGLEVTAHPSLHALRSWGRDGFLHMELEFTEEIGLDDDVVAAIFIDRDQDITTGGPPRFGLPHVLGAEFEATFNTDISRGLVLPHLPYNSEGGETVPLFFDHNRIQFSISLEAIGNQDGRVDLIGAVGASHPWNAFPIGEAASVGGPAWLDLALSSQTIGSGQAGEISLVLDATGLYAGTYEASLLITSNDPYAPHALIPIVFSVSGTPGIAIDPTSIDFGGVFVGAISEVTVVVENTGTDTLTVSSIQSGSLEISATPLTLTILPGQDAEVLVRYQPGSVGSIETTLTFSSDDPAQPEVVVTITGQGLEAPVANVSTSEIHASATSGSTVVESFEIANAGGSALEFALSAKPSSGGASSATRSATPSRHGPATWERLASFRGRAEGSQRTGGLCGDPLPVVIEDPAGDALGMFDVLAVRGHAFEGMLDLQIEFAEEVDADWLGGMIGLDIDRDASTGTVPGWALPTQELGVEYEISLFDVWAGAVAVFDVDFNFVGEYPAEASGNRVCFSIPLADINSDGNLHLGGLVGTGGIGFQPSDWFPDAGYGVIGTIDWIVIEPEAGTIDPGSATTVSLTFVTENLEPGDHHATLVVSTNDPQQSSIEIPVTLTVGSIGSDPHASKWSFLLHPAYPNPVLRSTTIQFDLPTSGYVELAVYNLQGRLVRSVVAEERPAGSYSEVLSVDGLASGVYLYRLRSGGFESSQRFMVVRPR